MWLLKTNPTWASLLPRLILAITFIPAGWYKLSDFQSKSLAWSVNFGFPVVLGGPGGFRKLREAGRINFHLSWYLIDSVVPSYDQKPWGREL